MSERHEHVSALDLDYEPPAPPGEKRRTRMILAFILVSVALAAVAQLTLKVGIDRVTQHGESDLVLSDPIGSALRVAKQPLIWGGLAMFALSAAAWLVVLSRVSLSFAYPFAALTYVLILLFDKLVLNVPVPWLRWGGVLLIITGIILISRTGSA